jgi:hypothetical protein
MKSNSLNASFVYSILILLTVALASRASAEKDRPAGSADEQSGDHVIAELLSRPAYNPLPGQIPLGVEDVLRVSDSLATIVNTVQPGSQEHASPWFAKLQDLRAKLAQLGTTKLQTDLFALISETGEFIAADGSAPEFVNKTAAALHTLDTVIVHSVKQYVIEQNAVISPIDIVIFIKVFSNNGFVNEPDWEDQSIPIDSAGIMILDAVVTVTRLKNRPWQEADRFLGNMTAAEAFARYAASGDGMAILRAKYGANQATISAKWNELTAWVAQQKAASP